MMRFFSVIFLGLFFATISHAADFNLFSTSFHAEEFIPKLYTCDGENISPQLNWQNPPVNTQSYVLILSSPDTVGGLLYDWILYNIPSQLTSLTEGANNNLPIGVMMGQTSIGDAIYRGPCPLDTAQHRYVFTLYALDTLLYLSENAALDDIIRLVKQHTLGKTQISGIFQH